MEYSEYDLTSQLAYQTSHRQPFQSIAYMVVTKINPICNYETIQNSTKKLVRYGD